MQTLVDECKHFYNELQIDEKLATPNYNIEMKKRDNSEIRESKSNPITLLCHVNKLKPILWPEENQSNVTSYPTF